MGKTLIQMRRTDDTEELIEKEPMFTKGMEVERARTYVGFSITYKNKRQVVKLHKRNEDGKKFFSG